MSTKGKALERMKKRWDDAQKDKQRKEDEQKRAQSKILQTMRTEGWQIIMKALQAEVDYLSEEIANTSAWSVFRGIELRNRRKVYKKLLGKMLNEEAKFTTQKILET